MSHYDDTSHLEAHYEQLWYDKYGDDNWEDFHSAIELIKDEDWDRDGEGAWAYLEELLDLRDEYDDSDVTY